MNDFSDIIFNEQWNKALEILLSDGLLIKTIEPYDLARKHFYYQLVENGIEKKIAPFGANKDLKKLIRIFIKSGIKGTTIPQATSFGDRNTIETLILTGHSIDEEDFGERTGLMVAAAFNNYELTSLLLGKGASISHYDQDNMEAIDFTIDKRIIEFLYSAGGRTKEQRKKDYDGYCESQECWNVMREINLSFMRGAETSNIFQMREALEKSPLKSLTLNFAYSVNGKTALHLAIEKNDRDVINFLVENGIDQDKKDIDGQTARDIGVKLKRENLFE